MMSRLLLMFATICLSASCVTFNRPSEQEMIAWRAKQDAIRAQISEEQAPLRKNLAQHKFNAPFLWRIEKSGRTSYLLGTMHVAISADELPYAVHSLFRKSNTHVYESDGSLNLSTLVLDEEKDKDKEKEKKDEDKEDDPEEPCLDETLTPTAWNVYNYDLLPFREFGVACLTPSDAYSVYINLRSLVLTDNHVSLDRDLMAESKEEKKKLVLLETPEEAMTALKAIKNTSPKNKMTAAEFSNYLTKNPLKDVKTEIAKTYDLAIAYKSGNFDQIDRATDGEMTAIYPDLIARRNQLWLPKLKDILSKGDAFVAVGAAHMMGPQSLIVLIEKEGFKMQRVQLSELKF